MRWNLSPDELPTAWCNVVPHLAAPPESRPTLTAGRSDDDFGDTAGLTPLLPMSTLGHDFVPPPSTQGACATTAIRRS